jgi:hypothetical protein
MPWRINLRQTEYKTQHSRLLKELLYVYPTEVNRFTKCTVLFPSKRSSVSLINLRHGPRTGNIHCPATDVLLLSRSLRGGVLSARCVATSKARTYREHLCFCVFFGTCLPSNGVNALTKSVTILLAGLCMYFPISTYILVIPHYNSKACALTDVHYGEQ